MEEHLIPQAKRNSGEPPFQSAVVLCGPGDIYISDKWVCRCVGGGLFLLKKIIEDQKLYS